MTGRKDDQVKIDGHRINLQEIEDTIIESGQAMECLGLRHSRCPGPDPGGPGRSEGRGSGQPGSRP
ncbi:MAG: hypothetical protein MZU79_07070 [Anaerotruncus sp.]|nr:hypothetical protein [Anaerotruncus sp.]